MLDSKEQYRFVPAETMRKIRVDGGILPLRNQKRIFRGEDEAFLEEAAIERDFPRQKRDFLSDATGRSSYGETIQKICGNGAWDSIVESLLDYLDVSAIFNIFSNGVFIYSSASRTSIITCASGTGRSNGVIGDGFLLPWRRDLAFPSQTIEKGGYAEESNDTSWAEFYIEDDADDARYDANEEAEDERRETQSSAYDAYAEENDRISAQYNAAYDQYLQRRSSDTATKNQLKERLDAANEALEEARDAEIEAIEEDDEDNKGERIQRAKDACAKAISENNYRYYRRVAEIDAATEKFINEASAEYSRAWDANLENYDKALDDAEFLYRGTMHLNNKAYYDTVKESCLYRIKCDGHEELTGVDHDIRNLALRSHIIDNFMNYRNAHIFIPYMWRVLDRLFADGDMMLYKGSWDVGMSRMPYYATWNVQNYVAYQDYRINVDCGAYHPTLGGFGDGNADAARVAYGDGTPESYSSNPYQYNYAIAGGGTKFYVRLGTRYTVGKIKSVKGIVKVSEYETKTTYDDVEHYEGRHYFKGNKWQWRVVNFAKKGLACQSECEAIDAIHDRYFEEYRRNYAEYEEEYGAAIAECEADVAEITEQYQAQIEAIEASRDAQIAEIDLQLIRNIEDASREANIRIDASDDKDEKAEILREVRSRISDMQRAANTSKSSIRSSANTQINSIRSSMDAAIRTRENERYDVTSAIWNEYWAKDRELADEESDEVDAITDAKAEEIAAKKKEYTDAWDAAGDDFSAAYADADAAYSAAYEAAQQIENWEARQAAIRQAEQTRAAAYAAAYNDRYATRLALMPDYINEEIWSINTEGREIWECEVPPIARQMSGGYNWYYNSKCETCLLLLVEYEFPTLTGANTSSGGNISSEYWQEVEDKTAEMWRRFDNGGQPAGGQQ